MTLDHPTSKEEELARGVSAELAPARSGAGAQRPGLMVYSAQLRFQCHEKKCMIYDPCSNGGDKIITSEAHTCVRESGGIICTVATWSFNVFL